MPSKRKKNRKHAAEKTLAAMAEEASTIQRTGADAISAMDGTNGPHRPVFGPERPPAMVNANRPRVLLFVPIEDPEPEDKKEDGARDEKEQVDSGPIPAKLTGLKEKASTCPSTKEAGFDPTTPGKSTAANHQAENTMPGDDQSTKPAQKSSGGLLNRLTSAIKKTEPLQKSPGSLLNHLASAIEKPVIMSDQPDNQQVMSELNRLASAVEKQSDTISNQHATQMSILERFAVAAERQALAMERLMAMKEEEMQLYKKQTSAVEKQTALAEEQVAVSKRQADTSDAFKLILDEYTAILL